MLKNKFAKALILGMCVAALSTGAASASTVEGKPSSPESRQEILMTTTAVPPDTVVSKQAIEIDDSVLKRQSEIDKLLFEQYKDEIAKKGFSVTHTGPNSSYVEVGITPFSEESAVYLYEILGRDMVKVIEGQQAVTLGISNANEAAVPIMEVDTASDKENGAKSTSNVLAYLLGGTVIVAGGVVAKRKLGVSRR